MAEQFGTDPLPGSWDAVYQQEFTVRYSYPVYFTEDVFDPANRVLCDAVIRLEPDRRHRLAVFVDRAVVEAWPGLMQRIGAYARAYPGQIELPAEPMAMPGGEAVKNDPVALDAVLRRLMELGIDRHSYALSIGGGAMLDVVGYAAAIAHRGVRLLRMPTTVLAQNDSGVGVKTGINAFGVKNMVGSFAPPFAVINDVRFLETLSVRDRIAGMAEAVKVALIRDGAFFAWLERNVTELAAFRRPAVDRLIRRCAELHMAQIAGGGDPFESGSARPLDYGHWAAHKLESLSDYALRHGEAVAIGLALDTHYSVLAGMLERDADERVCALLEAFGFRLWHEALLATDGSGERAVLRGLREFQEHLGGELTVTLLTGLGHGREVHELDPERVRAAIDWLHERDQRRCG